VKIHLQNHQEINQINLIKKYLKAKSIDNPPKPTTTPSPRAKNSTAKK